MPTNSGLTMTGVCPEFGGDDDMFSSDFSDDMLKVSHCMGLAFQLDSTSSYICSNLKHNSAQKQQIWNSRLLCIQHRGPLMVLTAKQAALQSGFKS